jgi:hypothetical protein
MRFHRLTRLARLTQGAALVGVGLVDSGCQKDPPPEPPHINSTATPTTTPPAPDAGPAALLTINAPHPPPDSSIMRHTINATATQAPTASAPPKP